MSDSRFAREAWLRALQATAPLAARGETLPQLVDRWAVTYDSAPALLGADGVLTFRRLAWRVNQFARWGIAQGLAPGDDVALLMGNAPDYLAVWLGLVRLGVSVALINPQQLGDGLAHSINIVKPKFTITDPVLALRLAAVRLKLEQPAAFVLGESGEHAASMEPELRTLSGAPLEGIAAPALTDNALYIYTSGTTGLPKAARVSHYRLLQWSHWFAGLLGISAQDRMYNCLPLCHSVGGVVAAVAPLVNGASVVIRARFSASEFWSDVRTSECTLFQYIGELCRYLANSAPQTGETEHRLRIACGNGLRADVWPNFQRRFGIPRIVEYYASTEGNFSLYNCEGEVGAIGRIPPFLIASQGIELVRHDVTAGEPLRDAQGLCERCEVDESGEALGRISGQAADLKIYTDAAASSRKVLRDVLSPGDAWYRSGDLMRRDARGFFYFVDRVGDTYRWKGENVSSMEVLLQLTALPGVLDGVVYGVAIPGSEGRAGMASLAVSREFDPKTAHAEIHARLAPYARPLFLRLVQGLETTATFKPRKHELVAEGFDPLRVKDPLYFDDPHAQCYVPIDEALFAALEAGKIRV